VPLLQLVIAPISFELSTMQGRGLMMLEIETYLSYFNEITGNWDLIVEPFSLNALASRTAQSIEVSFITSESININFPILAAKEVRRLAGELDRPRTCIEMSDLPQFWLSNELSAPISLKPAGLDEILVEPNNCVPVTGLEHSI
jgi:hypothetical protein